MAKGIDLPIQAIEVSESVLARQVISETLKSARSQSGKFTQRLVSVLSQLRGRSPQ
jgi:hypothetical protein